MYYYGYNHENLGWGHVVFGSIMMLLIWAVIIGGIIWVVRTISGSRRAPLQPAAAAPAKNPALEILDRRFAKGEIDEDEYRRRRAILDGTDPQ